MATSINSYTVPATNPEGFSLIIFRGAEGNAVLEKHKQSEDGRNYISRYIQLKFDILAANGKGFLKTNVFVNPKADSNGEERLILLNNLGMEVSLDTIDLQDSVNSDEALLGAEVTSFTLGAGSTDFTDLLNLDIPECDDDVFADEVLAFCEEAKGNKYFCKLLVQKQAGVKRDFVRYEIDANTVKLAAQAK